jgi:2-polyprenyl-6-methoxyphenol hydroxylase-like FAD-dependent oxidoreductase
MSDRHYDIVIAGGGMIGTSLALALAPLGLRVAVIEAVARKAAAQPRHTRFGSGAFWLLSY